MFVQEYELFPTYTHRGNPWIFICAGFVRMGMTNSSSSSSSQLIIHRSAHSFQVTKKLIWVGFHFCGNKAIWTKNTFDCMQLLSRWYALLLLWWVHRWPFLIFTNANFLVNLILMNDLCVSCRWIHQKMNTMWDLCFIKKKSHQSQQFRERKASKKEIGLK